MKKKELEYLQSHVKRVLEVSRQVESGELWASIYNTPEKRLAFMQGLFYANDVVAKFVGIDED